MSGASVSVAIQCQCFGCYGDMVCVPVMLCSVRRAGHGCPWADLELEGKTADAHFADWFYGRSSGAAALHVDTRMPNGGGTLGGKALHACDPFPNQTAAA